MSSFLDDFLIVVLSEIIAIFFVLDSLPVGMARFPD